ncbi:uncharacterized protein L201_002822 [Kwoniella dendrophila CBS 6074]|uniref:DUF7918 domain-containing protein n=1 Tax=Kwoniella dendrophila CBS 6074 TaxID=1295534 RepID=A0AAX4JR52_9TREE
MIPDDPVIGFEAWIENKESKVKLNEYRSERSAAKVGESSYTGCYLETIDEPFRICMSKSPGYIDDSDVRISVHADGNQLYRRAWLKGDNAEQTFTQLQEEKDGKYQTSLLRFAPLPTTDDPDKVTVNPATMQNIGIIEITLECGSYRKVGYKEDQIFKIESKIADEKEKKFAYSVSGTDTTICERPKSMHYRFTPREEGEYLHRFIFRYRPRLALIQMGIIDEPEESVSPPLPPPPIRRKRKSEIINVDEDEDDKPDIGDRVTEDIKPDLAAKRVKYLEEELRRVNSQLRNSRKAEKSKNDSIDLTLDD